MRTFASIFIAIAVITAGTSATRADELSELVAAVANTVTAKDMMGKDSKSIDFDAGKPRYKPKAKAKEIDVDLLEGVFKAMKRQRFHDMMVEAYGYPSADDDSFNQDYLYGGATLGRVDFYRPVPGVITSRFGWRPQFNRLHHGVDLSLHIGDTVRAALSGTIKRIAYDHDGYGHYVVMAHPDGMETVYGHLQYALVAQGQTVFAGQPLAIGGNTGNSTGPHLHFEARLGGVAVDPLLLFDFYGTRQYTYETLSTNKPQGPVYTHQSKSLAKEATYIVRYGDTLQSIARQAGLSVMRVCQLNMLNENDNLQVGRMIKLK